MVDAIIAAHADAKGMEDRRSEIRNALIRTGASGLQEGGTICRIDDIVIQQREIIVQTVRYKLSPSIPGLHRHLLDDSMAVERLRKALTRHHGKYGTAFPEVESIRHIVDITGSRYVYDAPAETKPLHIPERITHRTEDELDDIAAQIVLEAEGRRTIEKAIEKSEKDAERCISKALQQDAKTVIGLRRTGISIDRDGDAIHYMASVQALSTLLKAETVEIACRHDLATDTWHVKDRDAYVKEQRARRKRLESSGQGLLVDRVLARVLADKENKAPVRRAIFALSQGAEQRRTDWPEIRNAKPVDGRIIARVDLGNGIRWCDGEIVLKGRNLPETVIGALAGRPVSDVVDMTALEGAVIRSARNTARGLVMQAELSAEPYEELWIRIGGD